MLKRVVLDTNCLIQSISHRSPYATLVPVDEEHGAVFIYLTPKDQSPHVRCLNVEW